VAQSTYSKLRVGAVIAIALTLLCFGIFSIGHGSRMFTRSEILEAHFHRINGLQTGAPVKLAGLGIGAVESIQFPASLGENYMIVRIWVRKSEAPRVRVDSVATIDSMGLLGDKFVELTTGTSGAASAAPGAVLPSQDPVNYEALLQRAASDRLVSNVVAISDSMRKLLETINTGNGLLAQMVHGQKPAPGEHPLTLASLQRTLNHVDQLSTQMESLLDKINHGQGIMGELLTGKGAGQQFFATMVKTADAVQTTTAHLDRLMARFDKARGLASQLLENQQAGDQIMANLQASSTDLRQILHKINTGQGTVGLLVNDPTMYRQMTGFLADGGGWALRMSRGLYDLTHPFAPPASELGEQLMTPAQAAPASVMSTSGAQVTQPNGEAPPAAGNAAP
jgi:phospholipid/cholesterol/gamma-HCH transport system substrate-binding protein